MSQGRSAAYKVGVFTVAATGLLLAGVATLSSRAMFAPTVLCESYFTESINGLAVGSVVKYQGVTVGQVDHIGFPALQYEEAGSMLQAPYDTYVSAHMSLHVGAEGHLTVTELKEALTKAVSRGLRARVTMAGITGGAYVALEVMDPATYPELKVPWTPASLYIPSAPGQFDLLMRNIDNIAAGFSKIDFPALGKASQKLVEDIDRVVLDDAKPMLDQIEAASVRLKAVLDDPGIKATIDNLESTSADLSEVMGTGKTSLRQVIAALPGTIQSIKELSDRLDSAVAEDEPQIRQLIDQLNSIAANLDAVVRSLKTNPSRILFGENPPVQAPNAP